MEELVSRITEAVGIDESVAQSAIETILGFLSQEGPEEAVSALKEAMPDLAGAMPEAGGNEGGLLGGLASMGGVMGAVSELTSNGLEMGQIQDVAGEIIGYAKENAGEEIVDKILGNIPGLSQFL